MNEDQAVDTGRLRARDIMLDRVAVIGVDRDLDEARRALIRQQHDEEAPNALLIVSSDGAYAGILTARLLLKHLLGRPVPEGPHKNEEARFYSALLTVVRKNATRRVRDVLAKELPVVAPDDGLALLIKHGCEHRMEYIPVVADGRALGVVPITAVFTAAAALALRPDDEGIQVGTKRVK